MKSTPQTTAIATPDKHIAAANFKLAAACVMGGAAYFIWPDDPYWHGFYVLSVMLGVCALSMAGGAVHLIFKIRKFERARDASETLGKPTKEASLAEGNFITSKGVIRHGK